MKSIISLFCGLLFGAGLAASGMTDTAKVQGFLDVFGVWDPSLMFVMGGALSVTLIAFRLVPKMKKPLFYKRFHLPTKFNVDKPLITGACLFGLGWGLVGYCPGPAIASIAYLQHESVVFLVSMLVGGFMGQLLLTKK